jgi:polyhydroxyalkanoate synthesis regulator protein
MQMLVPRYLEVSLDSLTREQEKFRSQMAQAFGMGPLGALEDHARRNMEMFERAFSMFAPFPLQGQGGAPAAEPEKPQRPAGEIDDIRRQMADMQRRLDRMTNSEKKEG